MERLFHKIFDKQLLKKGYSDNKEYLNDNINRVKMLIKYYASCTINSNMNTLNKYNKEALEDFILADYHISSRLSHTNKTAFMPAQHIKNCFHLNDLEWFCILTSIVFDTDPSYKNILLRLSNIYNKNSLSYELIFRIYYFVMQISEIEDSYNKLSSAQIKMSTLCFKNDSIILDENIYSFILSGESKISLKGIEIFIPNNDLKNTGTLPIREKVAKKICNIAKSSPHYEQIGFYLQGEKGIGKKTLVKRASKLLVKTAIIIDLKIYAFLDKETFYSTIYTPLRHALIINSTICLDHFEIFKEMNLQKYEYLEFLLDNIPKFSKEIFILSDEENIEIPKINNSLSLIDISIENLSYNESYILWKSKFKELKGITSINPKEIANRFQFTPLQIVSTIEKAKSLWRWKGCKPLGIKDFSKCAYTQSISKISVKATLIKATHKWDELILDSKEKNMLRDACDQIRYRNIVYDEWGFGKRILYGRGLSMLFAGPPGTGKTMAAQVVANELGLEIYKADLSQVVSKYIGETEKNLNDLFNEAKKSNVILFFDETDALFGKRTEVKDSHDKNANVETSYLLQKMEEYDGITIMTTNYLENIDQAFFRRISYVIHFSFPNSKARRKIWESIYPKKLPLNSDIDFKYLSENFEISGGNIKNIAINSAFMAARDSKPVNMKHILKSTIYELKKQGKTLISDDLGEYAYLI